MWHQVNFEVGVKQVLIQSFSPPRLAQSAVVEEYTEYFSVKE